MTTDDINVVLVADARYAMPLAAAVRSVIDHHGRGTMNVRVFGRGCTNEQRGMLLDSWRGVPGANVTLSDIDHIDFGPLHGFNGLTVTTYARLFLTELVPAEWRRVIYLDADTITCTNLAALAELDLDGHLIAAVQDDGVPYVSSPHGVREWRELGLPATMRFFNAGVLVVDLEQWRARDIGRRALEYAQSRAGTRTVCDQEALNAIVAGDWLQLPDSWNVSAVRHDDWMRRDAQGLPTPPCYIRHYTTPNKPWNEGASQLHDCELFYRYLDRTRWAGWRPLGPATATAADVEPDGDAVRGTGVASATETI